MRVLQVHNRYRELGGEDVMVGSEAGLLRSAGLEGFQHQVQNPMSDPGAVGALAVSAWNPVAVSTVRRLVGEVRPDVAHVHNTWYSLSPAVVRTLRRAGVPVVMTLHNYRLMCVNAQLFRDGRPCELCVGSHPWRGVAYRCYRDSFLASAAVATSIGVHRALGTWVRDVELFFALTEFARERLLVAGLPPEKVVVKPNFVDDPGERMVGPSGSNRVLYVGRLAREKGVDVLLEAWRRASLSGLELWLVGDGPMRAELEADAPSGVHFAGRVSSDRVRELMLTSRSLTVPSIVYEGQPVVQLEALAAGLPMTVSNLGGVAETLGDSGAGIQVPAGDPSAWADALDRLTDDDFVEQAGRAARTRYQKYYTPQIALNQLTHHYQHAAQTFARS